MSRWMFAVLAVCCVAAAYAEKKSAPPEDATRTYEGAFFSVRYPADFKVRPSMKSRTSTEGYDSAFFRSPDGKVEFYVFSPQWNGEAADIRVRPDKETTASSKLRTAGSKRILEVDVSARDGSYERSFIETEDTAFNTRRVFGIKYADAAALKKHRDAYRRFKESLGQFAD